jgi:hypothetical protein
LAQTHFAPESLAKSLKVCECGNSGLSPSHENQFTDMQFLEDLRKIGIQSILTVLKIWNLSSLAEAARPALWAGNEEWIRHLKDGRYSVFDFSRNLAEPDFC